MACLADELEALMNRFELYCNDLSCVQVLRIKLETERRAIINLFNGWIAYCARVGGNIRNYYNGPWLPLSPF